jgi:hypothetical protein
VSAIEYERPWVFMCGDCGHDTRSIGEYYMVQDDLWDAALRRGGWVRMLCIGCLENRLGFTLSERHFIDCPLNERRRSNGSLRIRKRLGLLNPDNRTRSTPETGE